MFNIDPRIGVYLNGALLFVMAVGSGTIGLPPGVSPDLAHLVVAWAGWISVVANFFLHGVSSGNSGPFNQAPAPGRASSSLVVGILALGVAARLAGAPLAMLAAWATYGLLLALVACLLVDLWRLAAHMRRRSIGIVRSPALAVILATAIAAAPSQCSPTADLSAMARTIDAIVVKGQAIDAATMQAIKTNLPGAAKVAIQLDSYAQSLNSLGVLQPAVVAATNLATHNDPKAAAKAVVDLAGALAALHSFAGSSLVAQAANNSTVTDPATFVSQLVATATAVRMATRTAVSATAAVTTAPTSAAAITATAVASVGS